jgi:hypothetical protein
VRGRVIGSAVGLRFDDHPRTALASDLGDEACAEERARQLDRRCGQNLGFEPRRLVEIAETRRVGQARSNQLRSPFFEATRRS